MTDLNYFAETI